LHAQRIEQLDTLGMCHQRATRGSGVEFGSKRRICGDELIHCLRSRFERVHLAAQGFEFGQRNFAGPAFGPRRLQQCTVGGDLCRGKRYHAGPGEIRQQDIRAGRQIVLRMTADEFLIPGECDVAFEHARAHSIGREVGFAGVFRKL
jgi:hypothetical protein